jgi:hypothetical protein
MSIIMANMLQMCCDWWEPEASWQPIMIELKFTMGVFNIIFFVVYVIEMLLKWVGLGLRQYFQNAWNSFDFALVLISFLDILLTQTDTDVPFPAPVLRVLRLFRVARILRIIKTAKNLRTIMLTVYISVPQLKNILMLMMLIILITDMLLVGFFSSVNYTAGYFKASDTFYDDAVRLGEVPAEFTDGIKNNTLYGKAYEGESYHSNDMFYFDSPTPGTNWGDQINRHANFASFHIGLLTLARSSTGESFNGIMHDLCGYTWGHNRLTCCPQCGPVLDGQWEELTIPSTGETIVRVRPSSSCGETWLAWGIYIVFQMVMAYIVLSIMIGIILENFANVGSETKKIRMEDLEDFREVWLKYDPKGTFIVPSHNLLAILQQLKEPLGIQGTTPPMTRADMLKHLGKLDIPDHGGYIHFIETLTAVSNAACGEVHVPVCDTTHKLAKATTAVPMLKKLDKPAHNALTNYLVSLLQSRWRGYSMRRQYTEEEVAAGAGATPQALAKPKANQVAPLPPS